MNEELDCSSAARWGRQRSNGRRGQNECARVESAYARGITVEKFVFSLRTPKTVPNEAGNLHTTVITVSWATCIPGVIPAGEALEAALPAVAYGAGTAKALETALTGWP